MSYLPGEILLEKYRIEALLGQGAFGDVYRVTHLALNAPRAVKVLRRDAPGMGSADYSDAQRRFMQEGQLGARLNSPAAKLYLLPIHDFVIREDLLALEMEFAAGGSLAGRLERARAAGEPLAVEEALRIAGQVAAGLGALHELDVIYRDVKPANILFDEQGRARLGDLGLAQVPGGASMRSKLSNAAPHPGTAGYMSPEQYDASQYLTSASDVYSLGLVLFEMLTGRMYVNQRPGTRASDRRGDLPAGLDDLLARMLSKEKEERPWDGETAHRLLEEFGQAWPMQTAERKKAEEQEERRKAEAAQAEERKNVELERRMARLDLGGGLEMEFVRVPAGEFWMGGDPSKDSLSAYWIGKSPVTNRQYAAFVRASRRDAPGHWSDGRIPAGREEHPVVNVSWEDAAAFCRWASQSANREVRLPTEAEWEKAARGTDGRIYPWGDQAPDQKRCNYDRQVGGTTPVGRYSPQGDSPYGCVDMAGNVWEWSADWWYDRYPGNTDTNADPGTQYKVLRGGGWDHFDIYLCATFRHRIYPSVASDDIGFRCACPTLS